MNEKLSRVHFYWIVNFTGLNMKITRVKNRKSHGVQVVNYTDSRYDCLVSSRERAYEPHEIMKPEGGRL